MTTQRRPTAEQLVARFGLERLPVEGVLFRQTWRSADVIRLERFADEAKPAGTLLVGLLTDDRDSMSPMHRLRTDEVWHHYLGDAIELWMLHPGGEVERAVLGSDVLGGQDVQVVVPAGSWMGARLVAGGEWALFGNTMAPGFTAADFEGGDPGELAASWPSAAAVVHELHRSGEPRTMPPED
jgi:predicted cupin superfamily sugar epimerase